MQLTVQQAGMQETNKAIQRKNMQATQQARRGNLHFLHNTEPLGQRKSVKRL